MKQITIQDRRTVLSALEAELRQHAAGIDERVLRAIARSNAASHKAGRYGRGLPAYDDFPATSVPDAAKDSAVF